jgi:hypothetical protein
VYLISFDYLAVTKNYRRLWRRGDRKQTMFSERFLGGIGKVEERREQELRLWGRSNT